MNMISGWALASAGSGKTKLIIDRILKILIMAIEPNRILCITYTNVAIAEINARIRKRLYEWCVMDGGDLDNEITQLIGYTTDQLKYVARTLFATIVDSDNSIQIVTIHSFCPNI